MPVGREPNTGGTGVIERHRQGMSDIGGGRKRMALIEIIKAVCGFHPGVIEGIRQFIEGDMT